MNNMEGYELVNLKSIHPSTVNSNALPNNSRKKEITYKLDANGRIQNTKVIVSTPLLKQVTEIQGLSPSSTNNMTHQKSITLLHPNSKCKAGESIQKNSQNNSNVDSCSTSKLSLMPAKTRCETFHHSNHPIDHSTSHQQNIQIIELDSDDDNYPITLHSTSRSETTNVKSGIGTAGATAQKRDLMPGSSSTKSDDTILTQNESSSKLLWENETVIFLLNNIKTYNIKHDRVIRSHLYSHLKEELESNGFFQKVDVKQIENKVRRLERTYKEFVDDQNRTGNEKKEIQFENELYEAFSQKHDIHPQAVLSSSGMIKRKIDYNEIDEKPVKKKTKYQASKLSVSDAILQYSEDKRRVDIENQKLYSERTQVLKDLLNELQKK